MIVATTFFTAESILGDPAKCIDVLIGAMPGWRIVGGRRRRTKRADGADDNLPSRAQHRRPRLLQALAHVRSSFARELTSAQDKHLNFFTRSKWFRRMCSSTFTAMDMDGSGSLDVVEVYCGVLLLYTKVKGVCASATPPPKEEVARMLEDVDRDSNGGIQQAEFHNLASRLCQQVRFGSRNSLYCLLFL